MKRELSFVNSDNANRLVTSYFAPTNEESVNNKLKEENERLKKELEMKERILRDKE